MIKNQSIAAIIPCYKVRNHILEVISLVPPEFDLILCVDDCCPDNSGSFIESNCKDPRVKIIRNSVNRGVGGAVKSGYIAALENNIDIMIKIDGDGQMDPRLSLSLCRPITEGSADYVKGNRFHNLEDASSMPTVRLLGNAALSFITKLSSGYYNIVDPTNGFTAIHCSALRDLPLSKISDRYFFESDILFRLGISKAVVYDFPMRAIYGDEKSNLKIGRVLFEFSLKHFRNFIKRIGYRYFIRDFNIGSFNIIFSILFLSFGVLFGLYHWILGSLNLSTASAGTVMLSGLPIILGFQSLIAFFQHDVSSVPQTPISSFHVDKH